ncbi:TIGR00341 family protein [Nodosilinea sp. LEGE 06152]|uniref:TIGR00341 family protein n=1 Tax=Nodosilinea sp. LEGE 06152 TaxID=2777966 RepID=UPI0018807CE0|nr:TIGR00341 family protein [Nodosilinea sp. LEGE 06152]MBE9159296.1 TIGR00341 family protein [Nodosilinea sp. LEGE 06152]
MTQRYRYLKLLARVRRQQRKLWLSNSGDWQWLASKPMPMAGVNRLLWRESVPSLSFFVMLMLSGVISSLGLLAGSTATVIGAMIIAPLMGPIIGIAYAIAVANRRLMKRASLTLLWGTLATVFSSTLIASLIGLQLLNQEILLRTEPNLIDLMVAIAAGAAGAFAKSRKHVADAFPGVAIAVALVPPLGVIGIGIARLDQTIFLGATLLFITNLTGIIFSGILVFLWQRYGTLKRAQEGVVLSALVLVVLGIPLGLSLNNLLVQSNSRQQVGRIIRTELPLVRRAELQEMAIQQNDGSLQISLSFAAPPNTISAEDVQQSQAFLEDRLDQPVGLTLRVVPIQEFSLPANP